MYRSHLSMTVTDFVPLMTSLSTSPPLVSSSKSSASAQDEKPNTHLMPAEKLLRNE